MASELPPAAHSPKAKDDDEVLSQRTFPGQGEVQEAVMVAPGGETLVAGHMGEQNPMETDDGGMLSSAPIRARIRRPIRFRNPTSSLLQEKEVCLSRR